MWWARRAARALRRVALLVPLALLAAALILLTGSPASAPLRRPPNALLPVKLASQPPLEIKDDVEQQNWPEEEQEPEERRRPWFMRGGERRPQPSTQMQPLFPADAPDSDRIAEQLMYALPDDERPPTKKILLANGPSAWSLPATGCGEFVRNRCPVDRCSLTTDPKAAATADAVLFKDQVQGRSFRVKRPHKQIWILYYLESPYHTATMRADVTDVFNWTATYRRDSDLVTPYERWMSYDPPPLDTAERNYAANKTKKVAWFVSNCHARNKRLQYAKALSNYISVDIYGACGNLHCPRADPNCMEMLDRDYKFYLAFENSNCRDYITEKFFVNGLGRDILPIVMGARPSEYAAAAPPKSYVHVEEFAGPEELAEYLHLLDRDEQLYNSYFKWKGTGEFINTYFFCRVCALLHAAERQQRPQRYGDVQAWWRDDTCTHDEWRKLGEEQEMERLDEETNHL